MGVRSFPTPTHRQPPPRAPSAAHVRARVGHTYRPDPPELMSYNSFPTNDFVIVGAEQRPGYGAGLDAAPTTGRRREVVERGPREVGDGFAGHMSRVVDDVQLGRGPALRQLPRNINWRA